MRATERFSSRVENYVKFRPGYPDALVDLLKNQCGLAPGAVIADIGSGTGILTELLLRNGASVFGIEPNAPMREAGGSLQAVYPNFHSISGTAENTTLENHSIDLITAAQAFHWFDASKARREFVRILKPRGRVALIWNDRKISEPFAEAYEELLLTYGTDYAAVNHRNIGAMAIASFFSPDSYERSTLPNAQTMDLAALTGRLLSSSYAPEPGHPRHEPMLRELRALFETHQVNGRVTFEYDTLVYFGGLTPQS